MMLFSKTLSLFIVGLLFVVVVTDAKRVSLSETGFLDKEVNELARAPSATKVLREKETNAALDEERNVDDVTTSARSGKRRCCDYGYRCTKHCRSCYYDKYHRYRCYYKCCRRFKYCRHYC